MAADKVNKFTSLASYAQHRGVSRAAVTKAIQTGRLRQCITMKSGKPVITDVELADREWDRNTIGTGRKMDDLADANVPSIAVSRARFEAARAGLATIELLERKNKLVSVDGARLAVIEKFNAVRTKLLGVPSRIRQRIPHLSNEDVHLINSLIREALEDIAEGKQ